MGEKIDYSKLRECCNCMYSHVERGQIPTKIGLGTGSRVFCVKEPPVTHAVFVSIPGVIEPKCYAETTYPEPPFACSQFDAKREARREDFK